MGLIKQHGTTISTIVKVGNYLLKSGDIVKIRNSNDDEVHTWLFLTNEDAVKRLKEVNRKHFDISVFKKCEDVFIAVPDYSGNRDIYYVFCREATQKDLGTIIEIVKCISRKDLINLSIYDIWDKYGLPKF